MIDISVSHLLSVAIGIAIGMVAWSLWQRRANLTPTAVVTELASLPARIKD